MQFIMIHGGNMNERIAELYKKGYVEIEYSSPDIGNPDVISTYVARYFDPEKFAEVIVKECMSCVTWVGRNNTTPIWPVHTAHTINQRIKKHFGVEE